MDEHNILKVGKTCTQGRHKGVRQEGVTLGACHSKKPILPDTGNLLTTQDNTTERHTMAQHGTARHAAQDMVCSGAPLRCRWFSSLLCDSSSVLQGETETMFFIIGRVLNNKCTKTLFTNTPLHNVAPPVPPHPPPQHNSTQHSTTQHTAQHSTPQHSTARHSTRTGSPQVSMVQQPAVDQQLCSPR
jgi:hypothetical protein